jgi:hypothetical protein
MKKRDRNEELLNELFGETASFRDATLEQGLRAVRRTRRRRSVWRAAPVFVALILAAVFLARNFRHMVTTAGNRDVASVKVVPGTTIRVLSDDELLAFFKGRPVALVGQPGNQRLVLFDEVH